MAFDIQNLVSGGILKLNNLIDSSTVNPTVQLYPVDALKVQVDNTPANDVLLTELVVALSAKEIDFSTFLLKSEYVWLTGGVEKTVKGRQVVEYTATVRGLYNAHSNNPPTSSDGGSRNYQTHQPQATCAIPEDYLLRYLDTVFSAGTTTNSAEAGENLTAQNSVSLHTDGKLYKYHKTNYPNLVGVVTSTITAGNTATYTTYGGNSTGHSGLTIGATQYAENTGAITETSSTTTTMLGVSETATTIRLAKAGDPVTELTQAQVEDSASTAFGSVSGQRLAQANGLLGEVRSFASSITNALSISALIGLGWAVCDGSTPVSQGVVSPTITANTPNLVDKFIRGNASTSGATGGASSTNLPDHVHDGTTGNNTGQASLYSSNTLAAPNPHTHDFITNNPTTSPPISTIPPYYELVFMIKVR